MRNGQALIIGPSQTGFGSGATTNELNSAEILTRAGLREHAWKVCPGRHLHFLYLSSDLQLAVTVTRISSHSPSAYGA